MISKEIDVLIIGGGLTGAMLMLALKDSGLSTLLIEAKPFKDELKATFDARSLALSPASRGILTMLGIWDLLSARTTSIETIHVSAQHHFGISRLQGTPHTPLGYVVEMDYLNQAVHQLLDKNHVIAPASLQALDCEKHLATITTDSGNITIRARLIVAADGAHSMARQLCALSADIKQYDQHALVTNIGLLKSHEYRAYERFTVHGSLALLPMQGKRMSLVWAVSPQKAEYLQSLSEKKFLHQLHETFGYRLGRFVKVGQLFSYPLQQVLMPIQVKWPVIFLGNAAHTLHPVAGQGFNLGLRDVATLAQCIIEEGINASMLHHYVQLRSSDQKAITCLTDGLIRIFGSRFSAVAFARSLGLFVLDNTPALKNLLIRYARGFGGSVPDLVCEIPLNFPEIK